jgi:hypothetical protein
VHAGPGSARVVAGIRRLAPSTRSLQPDEAGAAGRSRPADTVVANRDAQGLIGGLDGRP